MASLCYASNLQREYFYNYSLSYTVMEIEELNRLIPLFYIYNALRNR